MACDHLWRQMHEVSLLGGTFLVGFKCEKCQLFVGKITGMGGTLSGRHELMGPHGLPFQTSSGVTVQRQVYDENDPGKLTYVFG